VSAGSLRGRNLTEERLSAVLDCLSLTVGTFEALRTGSQKNQPVNKRSD
jgi:hypothetical protein